MTSMFDYDDSVNMAFDAKLAGKKLVTAKHELLTNTGDFLFMAHSDKELAFRMQMVEEDIERTAHRRLANVSDSKAKLVRAVHEEWQLRHASCQFCKIAAETTFAGGNGDDPNNANKKTPPQYNPKSGPNDYHKNYETGKTGGHECPGCGRLFPTIEQATGAYGTCAACDLGMNPSNPDFGKKDKMGNPHPKSKNPFIPAPHKTDNSANDKLYKNPYQK